MQRIANKQVINKGKLTVLALALSGALAAMASVHAQTTTITSTQSWTGGGFNIDSNTIINVTSASGISASGTLGTLTNSGTVSGSPSGISNTGTITSLTNNASISGTTYGIFNGTSHQTIGSSISTLTNSGIISSASVGISNYATITSLNNTITGNIHGGNTGIANAGSISTLSNSGTISSGGLYAIFNHGTISTFTNSGTISATFAILNDTGATISTLINSGKILGGASGISNGGLISALTNSGTISGGSTGIRNYNATISTLTNSGLISGTLNALYIGGNSTLGSFTNTGTIAGNINNDTSAALTITGGSGAIFGTLTGYGGGISSSDIGSIFSSTISNLTFSGNQLLNDNIDVVGGTVTNTGALQVNNPLSINGNYVQGSGSTLVIGVTNPVFNGDLTDTGYGRLNVSGNATLDGSSVTVKSVSYALAQGQRYVVVAAAGTLSATGATYSSSGYAVTGSIQADSSNSSVTDLVLTLGAAISSGSGTGPSSSSSTSTSTSTSTGPINHATNGNASAALGGLFKYTGTDSALLAVFNPAAALDTAGANKAGAQLSPVAVTGAATQAAGASSQAVNNVATSHMDGFRVAQAGSSGVATGENTHDIAVWGQVFGGRAAQDMRDSVSGYHANYRGLLIGADGLVNDTIRAGALFSAAKTSVASDGDNTGSSADVNSYGLTAYATYSGSPWYVNALVGVARQQYSTVRAISYTGFSGIADGSFNGRQYTSAVQAGYPLNLDAWLPGVTLTPIAGLSYSSLRQNGYSETGGSGAALTVNASSSTSLKSELGAKLENSVDTSYGKLLPSVQLGWRHEYKDSRTQSGASFTADSTGSTAFVTQSATPVANVGVLNLGVTLLQSKALTLSGKYTLESGGGYLAQTGSVQVRWQY